MGNQHSKQSILKPSAKPSVCAVSSKAEGMNTSEPKKLEVKINKMIITKSNTKSDDASLLTNQTKPIVDHSKLSINDKSNQNIDVKSSDREDKTQSNQIISKPKQNIDAKSSVREETLPNQLKQNIDVKSSVGEETLSNQPCFTKQNQNTDSKSSERDEKTQTNQHTLVMSSNYLSSIIVEKPFRMKVLIDTGAEQINLLSEKTFKRYKEIDSSLPFINTSLQVQPLGGKAINTLGAVLVPMQFGNGPNQFMDFLIDKPYFNYKMIDAYLHELAFIFNY